MDAEISKNDLNAFKSIRNDLGEASAANFEEDQATIVKDMTEVDQSADIQKA